MKITVAMVLAAVVGSSVWAKPVSQDSAPVITVCMDQFTNASVAYRAQGEASRMFLAVPVRIAWSSGRACTAIDAIHVHLSDKTPAALNPGALAHALPYQGTYIEIFYDRVEAAAGPEILPNLLAHVLVHEITHILQGIARHSDTGIMKAHWTVADFREMGVHPLRFTPEDVQLIQLALQSRTERLEALNSTPK
jgi:hypothetical protein